MTVYRIRTVKPVESEWFDYESSAEPSQAVQDFHCDFDHCLQSIRYYKETETGGHEILYFALIEIEGQEPVVSKLIETGIWRKGGMKPWDNQRSIESIAQELGWTLEPAELVADWEGEESYEEARERVALKWKKHG